MRLSKILLIGNNQALLEITKKILGRAGYSIICAYGPLEAMERLAIHLLDCIILMGGFVDISRFSMCVELRKNCKIPIIFISNSNEDKQPAINAGANCFMKKPFDYEELKMRVSLMLDGTGHQQETDYIESGGIVHEISASCLMANGMSFCRQ